MQKNVIGTDSSVKSDLVASSNSSDHKLLKQREDNRLFKFRILKTKNNTIIYEG